MSSVFSFGLCEATTNAAGRGLYTPLVFGPI